MTLSRPQTDSFAYVDEYHANHGIFSAKIAMACGYGTGGAGVLAAGRVECSAIAERALDCRVPKRSRAGIWHRVFFDAGRVCSYAMVDFLRLGVSAAAAGEQSVLVGHGRYFAAVEGVSAYYEGRNRSAGDRNLDQALSI